MSCRLLPEEDFQVDISQSFLPMPGNTCQVGPCVKADQSARQKKTIAWREANRIECVLDNFGKYVGTGFV